MPVPLAPRLSQHQRPCRDGMWNSAQVGTTHVIVISLLRYSDWHSAALEECISLGLGLAASEQLLAQVVSLSACSAGIVSSNWHE